jgi:hypothetical protein
VYDSVDKSVEKKYTAHIPRNNKKTEKRKKDKKMRHGNANRRQRNRGGSRRGGAPNRSQVFDSNGPDVRIRGTAHQIVEKYAALAKDASSSGDHTLAENYLQHAEHYQRIINSWAEDTQSSAPAQQEQQAPKKKAAAGGKAQAAAQDSDEDLGLPVSMLKEAPTGKKEEEIA